MSTEQRAKELPAKYSWLSKETAPASLMEALRHYGLMEKEAGSVHPDIRKWSKELGVSGWFPGDDYPWCGAFVGICIMRAGYTLPQGVLGAKNWLKFGTGINKADAMLGDILVFEREGGGHVGFYVGENKDNFLVYGGNQSNAVGLAWIAKSRCVGVRRCPWKIGQPSNVRKILLTFTGELSTNEA